MSYYVTAEKNVKLRWLPSVASTDLSVATPTELEAGIDINAHLLTSGIGIEFSQTEATARLVETGKVVKAPGTTEASIQLTSLRSSDEDDDVIWETFEQGLTGVLLVSRFGTPSDGSRVELYECISGDPRPVNPTDDDFQQSVVSLSPTDWNLKATVGSA